MGRYHVRSKRRANAMGREMDSRLIEAMSRCECCKVCLRGVCDGCLLGKSCDRFCVCEEGVEHDSKAMP